MAKSALTDLKASALDQLDEGVMITDARLDRPGPSIVYVNPAWERLTGYSAAEAVGATPRLLQGPATSVAALRQLRASLAATGTADIEVVNYRRDGSPFRMAWSISPLRSDGAITHYLALQRDVTRRRAEAVQLRQLEALTRLQREVATGSLDMEHLRQRVAEVALEVTGADGAVVAEAEGSDMVYRAGAGAGVAQVGMRLPVAESVSGLAHRRNTSLLCRDATSDARLPRPEEARQLGFASGVVVPLTHEQRTYGVLKVFAREPGRFGEEDRQLLELGSGVVAATLHRAADYASEVGRRGLLLDAIPALISYIDRDRRYQEVNAAYEQLFGMSAEAIRGHYLWELAGEEGYERIRPYVEAALRGERVSYENEVPLATAEPRTYRGDYLPHIGRDGSVLGLYAIVRDITDSRQAQTDYLTGLVNRREFEREGARLLAVGQRYEEPLSLVMVDVDRFKAINDRLGHLAGDAILQAVAGVIREISREADLAGRWGGEEFVLLLPATDGPGAGQLAERLRLAVADTAFPGGHRVTASLGVATATFDDDLHSLQARADRALYAAKHSGRNRVATDRARDPG
jgi:diguanylate cyclase (GGDEF)-like protein/PAS domain S-box-containing protein